MAYTSYKWKCNADKSLSASTYLYAGCDGAEFKYGPQCAAWENKALATFSEIMGIKKVVMNLTLWAAPSNMRAGSTQQTYQWQLGVPTPRTTKHISLGNWIKLVPNPCAYLQTHSRSPSLGSRFCTINMLSEGTSRASLEYLAAHT